AGRHEPGAHDPVFRYLEGTGRVVEEQHHPDPALPRRTERPRGPDPQRPDDGRARHAPAPRRRPPRPGASPGRTPRARPDARRDLLTLGTCRETRYAPSMPGSFVLLSDGVIHAHPAARLVACRPSRRRAPGTSARR